MDGPYNRSQAFPQCAYSIYIHIPFCQKRCTYCDFNTVAGKLSLLPRYVNALCTEIVKTTANTPGKLPVHTIFFGGGTPTLLLPEQVKQILTTLSSVFQCQTGMEITMEGNPGTLNQNNLIGYRETGVNRLSLGVQSTNPEELTLLGRIHTNHQTLQSIQMARNAGFTNINLDLIYGLPAQELHTWQHTLRDIVALHPTHLSLYALKVEDSTPLEQSITAGQLPEPDPDLAADMYDYATEFLGQNGYCQYEISNWAHCTDDRQYESRHNRQYWENLPYFGFGAGSHALLEEQRLVNEPEIQKYMDHCENDSPLQFPMGPATIEMNSRSLPEAMDDQMILGLRLTRQGVSIPAFISRFGIHPHDRYPQEIDRLIAQGLLEYADDEATLRITSHGRLLGNQVFVNFLKA